jgi:hypothetical protein
LQLRAQVFDGAAGVDQGAESHVTADSAKTIKIGEFHNDPPPGDGAGTAKIKLWSERNDSIGGVAACQTSEPPKNVWAKT